MGVSMRCYLLIAALFASSCFMDVLDGSDEEGNDASGDVDADSDSDADVPLHRPGRHWKGEPESAIGLAKLCKRFRSSR